MLEGEKEKLLQLESHLRNRVIGQEEALSKTSDVIRMSKMGVTDMDKPLGSFLFMGNTGVGKTELGKTLAEALFDDDAKLEKIYNSLYNLNEFTDPKNFKSYEKLKERLDSVLGLKKPVRAPIPDSELETEDEGRGYFAEQAAVSEPVKEVAAVEEATSDEDDESLSYFSRLVNS